MQHDRGAAQARVVGRVREAKAARAADKEAKEEEQKEEERREAHGVEVCEVGPR
jgi:hypothetical protein